MKNQKGISLIVLLVLIIIVLTGILVFKFLSNKKAVTGSTSTKSTTNIEDIVLNKDNAQETIDKYGKLKEGTDELVYVTYAMMNYMFSANTSKSATTNVDAYQKIYGKTLKELKEEGKQLMKKNNVTVEEFKKNMNKK